MLSTAVCLVLGLVCGVFPDGKRLLVRVVLWVFVAVCAVAIIEVILGHNLFARFVDPPTVMFNGPSATRQGVAATELRAHLAFPLPLQSSSLWPFPSHWQV